MLSPTTCSTNTCADCGARCSHVARRCQACALRARYGESAAEDYLANRPSLGAPASDYFNLTPEAFARRWT